MPIHLGIALFGASTAITAIHRTKVTLKNKKVYDADESRSQYVRMKWMTWAMDYSFVGLMFFFFDKMNKTDDNLTPTNVFIQICKFVVSIFAHDLIKAFWFRDLVAKAKLDYLVLMWQDFVHACITIDGMKKNFSFLLRILKGEGWLTEFTDSKEAQLHSVRHNIWYIIKIGIILIPAVGALQVNYGMMYWLPITETVRIYGKGEWYETHVSRLVVVYMEFLVVMFIKDGISMNIFHQMMHSKWYNHHKTHHLTMKELSIANSFYFDILDVIVENGIGPTFLCLLKFLFGAEPSFHYYTFLLATGCDINIHSINPYSVAFWNPLFDNMMKCALSHNLHHSTNVGHYTIWPLHQIPGMGGTKHKGKNSDGFDYDIREYNKIFETRFPEDL